MTICDDIQQRLAEDGADWLQDDAAARTHVADCPDCTEFLESLTEIEDALRSLPELDAPDNVVAATLQAVQDTPVARPVGRRQRWMFRAAAASVMVIASATLLHSVMNTSEYETVFGPAPRVWEDQAEAPVSQPAPSRPQAESRSQAVLSEEEPAEIRSAELDQKKAKDDEVGQARLSDLNVAEAVGNRETNELAAQFRDQVENKESAAEPALRADKIARGDDDLLAKNLAIESESEVDRLERGESARRAIRPAEKRERQIVEGEESLMAQVPADPDGRYDAAPPPSAQVAGPIASTDESDFDDGRARAKADAVLDELGDGLSRQFASRGMDAPSAPADRRNAPVSTITGGAGEAFELADRPMPETEPLGGLLSVPTDEFYHAPAVQSGVGGDYANDPAGVAQAFLNRYAGLDGLQFVPAIGYWSNSYIPGDPAMRLLQARLGGWDRRALGANAGLEQGVSAISQPFDAPTDAALAVYLNSDVSAVQGPTRMRVQVGLRGADRKGGRRPAMNIALLVDPAPANDLASQARIRALVMALSAAWQPGDRFSLIATGPNGGTLVAPGAFGNGPVQVALDRLFAPDRDSNVNDIGVLDAMALAGQAARDNASDAGVLGTSLILFAASAPIGADIERLESIAHDNAVAGINLSAVQLAAGPDAERLDRLVAAGQGHRRVLDDTNDAAALIDRELHAASRAVARAVRLRIQLAPGVKLNDVLGAERLDEPAADRVRAAEQAIDQRLARNLGIAADRGEDEHGIQIVIPHFYASDSHVVLLDVVAERAGPVAEVTVRYKDLVSLGNGVARAGLSLPSGDDRPGPLQRHVLKNLVAWYVGQGAREAAARLDAGDWAGAQATLMNVRNLLAGLAATVTGWASDPDLAADRATLDQYLAVLTGPAAADNVQRGYLAESLRYAAHRKTHTSADR